VLSIILCFILCEYVIAVWCFYWWGDRRLWEIEYAIAVC
jgi:hypothetical protein